MHDALQVKEVVWVVGLALAVVLPSSVLVHACGSSLPCDACVLQGLVQEGLEAWVRRIWHACREVRHSVHAVGILGLLKLWLLESLVLAALVVAPLV